jgi:hypothetical protein
MIRIIENKVVVAQDSNKEYSKFWWDNIDLMANRFVVVFINSSKKLSINYEKSASFKFDKDNVVLLEGSNFYDFSNIIAELNDNCIHDFYLTLNASLNTIKNYIEEKNDFFADEFMKSFPRTIHIKEKGFEIDLNVFSNYAFQIERIVKRYD